MGVIPLDFRGLKSLIDQGYRYKWVLPRDDVSGTMTWNDAYGFHIPCGEEPREEPSRVMDGDILKYVNNGTRKLYRYHESI